MSKSKQKGSSDRFTKSWNAKVSEAQETFSALTGVVYRLSLITPRNCGVLNSLPNFPALLQSTHIELCEELLSSLQNLITELQHVISSYSEETENIIASAPKTQTEQIIKSRSNWMTEKTMQLLVMRNIIQRIRYDSPEYITSLQGEFFEVSNLNT